MYSKVDILKERNASKHVIDAQLDVITKQTEEMCNKEHSGITFCDIKYKKCLCNYSHPNFNELMIYYDNYKNGNLPFNGCVADQPAQIMELLQIIDNSTISLHNEALMKGNKKNGN
jgi:hypothetical protein